MSAEAVALGWSGPRVLEARGIVRDAIAAIRNLENLLRSPRVGPRALASVIPNLLDLCVPLQASVDDILRHVAERTGASESHRALSQFLEGACAPLQGALTRASQGALDAKARLALEARVGVAALELNAVRELVEMLRATAESVPIELELEQVIHEAFAVSSLTGSGPSANTVRVVASFPDTGCSVFAQPQVIMPLLSLAIALISDRGVDPYLQASCATDGALLVTASGEQIPGDVFLVRPTLVIAPTRICAQTAAAVCGGTFEVDDEVPRVSLTWPASPPAHF